MNLDFRKLDRRNQVKAINEVIRYGDIDFMAHLVNNDSMDVWGWFPINKSVDGMDYWIDLKEKVNNE
jgi:hypothetical protein